MGQFSSIDYPWQEFYDRMVVETKPQRRSRAGLERIGRYEWQTSDALLFQQVIAPIKRNTITPDELAQIKDQKSLSMTQDDWQTQGRKKEQQVMAW